ncbi:MAG: cytochrome C oxidase subunit I, partial [Gemmatimonadota bacterium]|nr:cytochrome C oxidase subunit I [Gemmatimonadota bacterium]
PRRHYDISFTGAPFDIQYNAAVDLLLGIMGIGGLIAATAVVLYILIAVWSVFFGKPMPQAATAGE